MTSRSQRHLRHRNSALCSERTGRRRYRFTEAVFVFVASAIHWESCSTVTTLCPRSHASCLHSPPRTHRGIQNTRFQATSGSANHGFPRTLARLRYQPTTYCLCSGPRPTHGISMGVLCPCIYDLNGLATVSESEAEFTGWPMPPSAFNPTLPNQADLGPAGVRAKKPF